MSTPSDYVAAEHAAVRAAADSIFGSGTPAKDYGEPAPIPAPAPVVPTATPVPDRAARRQEGAVTASAQAPEAPTHQPEPASCMPARLIMIQGKPYCPVSERIRMFRAEHPDWAVLTDVIAGEAGKVVVTATIKARDGFIVATGHASEVVGSSHINRTSALENCETSAVGRALGFLGYGVDTSVASSDEVMKAQRHAPPPPAAQMAPIQDDPRRAALRKEIADVFHQLPAPSQAEIQHLAGGSLYNLTLDRLIAVRDVAQQMAAENIF